MHDAKGRELKIGDRVIIPCTINEIYASVDFCNCRVTGDYPMPGSPYPFSVSSINTQQLLRANEGDAN